MIVSMILTSLVFSLLVSLVCHAHPEYAEEEAFLVAGGLSHLVDNFKNQEITMDLMTRLSDSSLKDLGITTMGKRIRFMDSARAWVERRENDELILEVKNFYYNKDISDKVFNEDMLDVVQLDTNESVIGNIYNLFWYQELK